MPGFRSAIARRRAAERGLTLIEVLIVVALIAMLSGAVMFGPGMFSSGRLRAAATLIVSAIRVAQTQANAGGRPVRLALDLDQHQIVLEEARGSVMLREKGSSGGADPATEAEAAARHEAERIVEGPRAPRASFTPVRRLGFGDDDNEEAKSLGRNIAFRMVQTERDDEPRTSGRAYLYFWPGGETERAVIQLYRGDTSEEGLTISLSPLTGRSKIERGRVGLPEPRFGNEEISEREDR
jgi:general secretion pathway protein H